MSDLGLGLTDAAPPRPGRGRGGRRGRTSVTLAVAVVVLLVAGAGAAGFTALRSFFGADPDYAGLGTGSVVVQVHAGDTAADIATTLHAADVVKSTGAFRSAARANSRSRTIQPGYYRLKLHMKASAALALMLDPAALIRSRVTVPEGSTLARVLELVAKGTEIPLAGLEQAAKHPSALGTPAWAGKNLEGLLFPATYDFSPSTSAADALAAMVDRFGQAAQDVDLEAGAAKLHRSPYDVVIIASLIEAEAKYPADYGKVARVVYNRLARGMPLQFDSTVNYVLERRKVDISYRDLKVQSAFNTYLHKGLPPGAINSPGDAALKAALAPAPGNWLYFVTIDKQGHNAFTASYDEFLRLKAKGEKARK